MDVEKPSPDLIGEIIDSKNHSSKNHHHGKSKDHHHQPVTLQQVQAQQHKNAQKQRLMMHRKHHTPNKQTSATPLKNQKDVGGNEDLPELKSIATIKKQLDALSQEAEKIQKKTLALANAKTSQGSTKSTSKSSQAHPEKHKHKANQQKPKPSDGAGEDLPAVQKTQVPEQPPPALHTQLSQPHQDSPQYAIHHQQPKHLQQQAANNSPATAIDPSSHANTPPNLADTSSAGAPLLDHMSSFFQSSQTTVPQTYSTERTYNNNYPSQSYNYHQAQSQPQTSTYPPSGPPPFPQPTLPQGLPQPPQQQGYTQSNYMNNNGQQPQQQQQQQQPPPPQQYPDNSSQTYSTYSNTQPQIILPPPPNMFHGTPGWL
jgi:myosin heavy subunit